MGKILRFFDKLEDKVRHKLSQYPIIYACTGGVGVVVFWRGVWHTADFAMEKLFSAPAADPTINLGGMPWWDGPLSLVLGGGLLMITGVFVSNFIGNEIIISGLRGEKKLAEKTESEIRTEVGAISDIRNEVREMSQRLSRMEQAAPNINKQDK